MNGQEIKNRLDTMRDETYAGFQRKLIPNIPPETIIGVRTPALRQFAKTLSGTEDAAAFLRALPHRYFDENQLHAFLLSLDRDFDRCMAGVEAFLPFVDNWATCDQLSPKVFGKNRAPLLEHIKPWLSSSHSYTVRFGVCMLMQHFLGDAFQPAYPQMVAALRSEEYYVNMMVAWYFATALAKRYSAVLPYLEERRLPVWIHQKTIQKALESYRIPPERKEYLRRLKIM